MHRYIVEALRDHVLQFIGDKFVIMHDNAKSHIPRIVTEYLVD